MAWGIGTDAHEDLIGGKWLSVPLRRIEKTAGSQARRCTEHAFRSWDGSELFYRQWPASETGRHAVILIHRGHEHSGWLQELVDQLNLPECAIFAWDARGHGRSPG